MNALPARQASRGSSLGKAAGYVTAALALGLLGALVAAVADVSALVPTRLLATGGAIALLVRGTRTHTLTSPLSLLGVPLLLSLAAATLPITRIFNDWTNAELAVATVLVVAPLAGVAAAVVATGRRVPRLEPGTDVQPYAFRLVCACVLMALAGTIVYFTEWQDIGGPPLLSPKIDEARFSLVQLGALHVVTEGIPIAFLIAVWARVARPRTFTWPQRRVLDAVVVIAPIVLILGGGRSLVILPLIGGAVVAARYLTPGAMRRLTIWLSVAVLVMSSVVFLTRLGQNASQGPSQAVLYDSGTGRKANPFESAYRAMSINMGEQLRVVLELREANVTSPPFTTSIWFLHNIVPRAIDPHTITQVDAGGWLTSMYAGQLLLDFGLIPALLFGIALGAAAHLLYRRFAKGRSVTVIWLYAYLAGPIAMSFYVNMFLYFVFPIIDVIGLLILSRVLIRPSAARSPARTPAGPSTAPSLA